jgi:GxxExxY protein
MHSLFARADRLSGEVIGAAIEVHRIMGRGLLESIYERCLMRELELRGVPVLNQEEVVIDYKGTVFKEKLKFDLLADGCLLVEPKAIRDVLPIHKAQLLSYMKLLNVPLGSCSTSMRSSSLTESQGLSCPMQTSLEQKETKATKCESAA